MPLNLDYPIEVSERHKVKPIKAINKLKSRYAYKIAGYKGLWSLEGFNLNTRSFIYRVLK
jgi:hypothetical protein